ncbi:MAG: hypothetical protein HY079_00965 [Elusimicrobia bacterium]|nr:hypothetical protein [Elusimicrobiota bacterium]
MTPRHAPLLLVLLAAVPARAAAPEVPAPIVEAFVAGRPVRAALGPGAAVPEPLTPLLGQAEVVQAGGTAEQDEKKFRAAVLAVADGFGVKEDAKRAALLRLYLDRRASGGRASPRPRTRSGRAIRAPAAWGRAAPTAGRRARPRWSPGRRPGTGSRPASTRR